MKRRYFAPASMFRSALASTPVIRIGAPAAVDGLICITPTAPTWLFLLWSIVDSW